MSVPLSIFIEGEDSEAIVRGLARHLPDARPSEASADYEDAGADWLDAVAGAAELARAEWSGTAALGHLAGQGVQVDLAEPATTEAALEILAGLPWLVATFPSYAAVWAAEHGYSPPGFDGGHGPHGWACAFRADGHDRLVSRRWLPAGPWKLTERADVSFVEFHDPAAAPGEAITAARPGHARMGITDEGGYVQQAPLTRDGLSGIRDGGTFKIVVNHRDVPQREMLAACQLRRDEPVRTVAFVFTERDRAEAHQHELWLRELECWAIADGREVQLTAPTR